MEYQELGRGVFWLVLASLIAYEFFNFFRGKSSEKWKPLHAKVLNVGIRTREAEGTEESKPFIKYQYNYLGGRYTGSKVKFGDLWSSSYGKASAALTGIVRGSEVTIYINPKCPNQSVLCRGYQGNIYWQVALVAALVAIAVES